MAALGGGNNAPPPPPTVVTPVPDLAAPPAVEGSVSFMPEAEAQDSATPPGPQEHPVLERARAAYPFINKFNPHVKVNPRSDAGYAETFGPDEPGAGKFMRPQEFPMGHTGIEIYRPDKFSEHDLAAEFLHVDPRAHQTRADLLKTFTPRQLKIMQHEPDYTESIKSGQSRDRAMQNMTDSVMRGYTVGQWPKHVIDDFRFTDKQKGMLDGLKRYMTTGKD